MSAPPVPRRVLFLAWAPFFSGAERALLLTLRALDPARYQPTVIAGTPGTFEAEVRAMGIPCRVAPLVPLDRARPGASLRSLAAVARAAIGGHAAIIHANEVPSFQPAGYVARLLRIPAVTHVRFPNERSGYEWFLRSGFARALFVSHDLERAALAEAPLVFGGRTAVLHDGVEMQPEWDADMVARMRQELGVPVSATVVAMAGQVAEVKGIWDFVEAAALLAARGAEPFFVVLGDDLKTGGATRRAMMERVAALDLSARFAFPGFRLDAPRIMQAFDIIAVPSHVEPLGNATLEAMASGRPVVGSRVGGIPEMVVDQQTGLLVPPRTPEALADALAALVMDPSRRRRMSDAARRRAREAFSLEAHGERLQACYDALCARVPAPAAHLERA